MNKTNLLTLIAILAVIVACHTSKKTTSTAVVAKTETTTTVASSTTANTIAVSTSPYMPSKKTLDGIYDPGSDELAAIQLQYKDATMEQLKQGYALYAKTACISCHGAVNIYRYREDRWTFIIQDMAYRAQLTPTQKDAVLKYVYAIKATDPNKNR